MRRRVIAGGVLVIAAIAALFGGLMLRPTRKPFVTVNGIRITVEGVSFGTNHTFTTDSALMQRVRQVLPTPLRRLLSAGYAEKQQTAEEQLLIYLSAFDPAAGLYVNAGWDRFEILDAHGCIFPVNSWSSHGTVGVRSFPRRAPVFILRGHATGRGTVELTVPNPIKGPFPNWTAEPLPARRTIGDLTFELGDIRARWSTNVPNAFTPEYGVFRNGHDVTPEWRPIMNLRDAIGNRAEVLCPYEDVWKVELKFLKTAKASFSPGQVWRIPSVRVPDDGRTVLFNQSHSLGSVEATLIALTGPGHFKFSNNVVLASAPWTAGMSDGSSSSTYGSGPILIEFTMKEPSLLAAIIGLSDTDEVLIRYRDKTARVGEAVFRNKFGNQYRYAVPDLQSGTSVDLEVILQEPITVEFSAKPPSPPTIVTKP